jgi:hypothetical protein
MVQRQMSATTTQTEGGEGPRGPKRNKPGRVGAEWSSLEDDSDVYVRSTALHGGRFLHFQASLLTRSMNRWTSDGVSPV